MNRILVTVLIFLIQACSQTHKNMPSSDITMPDARSQLLTMRDKDQQVRQSFSFDKKPTPEQIEQLNSVDNANTLYIKDLVKTSGWPSVEMIGTDGVRAFWLLLQHTNDYDFHKNALPYITALRQERSIGAQNYSLFVDRVLIHDGKLQKFGTQIKEWKDQQPIPYEIDDPENVNLRRAKIGLFPIEEYFLLAKQIYYSGDEFDKYLNDDRPEKNGSKGFHVTVEGEGSLKNMTISSLTVVQIEAGSAAEKSGLQIGDSIVQVNGIKVEGENSNKLMDTLNVSAGEKIRLVVSSSDGEHRELEIIASEKPNASSSVR
jgi:Family of unknown function (DUF6624)/PDZ domain